MNRWDKNSSIRDQFILDENNNAIPANLFEWSNFFENTQRRIVKQEKINNYMISTVFLGNDHNYCWDINNEEYKPHIFETMVFPDNLQEIYLDRYSNWQEAEEGHKRAVQWVKDGCNEDE